MTATSLSDQLQRALAEHPHGPLCVAFSGGSDSTALLHALAASPQARARDLRALHVDHGLQADSARWAAHAVQFCASLELPCDVLRVEVAAAGEGPEAAARHARYAALAAQLGAGEWLLLGHHRDDQAETVLLKLLRGAGPEGLAGMRAMRPLGRGWLWRPLLNLPRALLRDYLAAHHLSCIDDPSNADLKLARNFLRHDLLPRLQAHWPQAIDSIVHSAALSRAADDALRNAWLADYERLHDAASGSLDAIGWLALAPALRQPLLDHWLHARGLAAPTTAQRRELERQQREARPGRLPCVRWQDTELHLWRDRWWAIRAIDAVPTHWQSPWHGEPLALPGGGELRLDAPVAEVCWPQPLQVRFRQGGERIKPAGNAHTRELRDLFQQGALPPWLRPRCPLIYEGEQLIAVADRWRSQRAQELFAALGATPVWRP